jgi:hypothetical protein
MVRLPHQCAHIMAEGVHCGSPAMRQNRFCYHHQRQREQLLALRTDQARAADPPFALPLLEDAASIQLALTLVMRALAAGRLDPKKANLLLYSLQIATTNLRYATLDKLP